MNKKDNPSEVLAARATIRYKMEEYEIVKQKAQTAGVSFSDFCRQIGKTTQIDPLIPAQTDPHSPEHIDPLSPFQNDPLKAGKRINCFCS